MLRKLVGKLRWLQRFVRHTKYRPSPYEIKSLEEAVFQQMGLLNEQRISPKIIEAISDAIPIEDIRTIINRTVMHHSNPEKFLEEVARILDLDEEISDREKAVLAEFLGGIEAPWTRSERSCPECQRPLFATLREDEAYEPALVNIQEGMVRIVDQETGTAKTIQVSTGQSGIPLNLDSREYLRKLRLYVCPHCWFRGYVVEYVNPKHPEAARYGASWVRMKP